MSTESANSESLHAQLAPLRASFEEVMQRVRKADGNSFDHFPSGDRAYALARLIWDKNPALTLRAEVEKKEKQEDGVVLVVGVRRNNGKDEPYSWVEVVQGGNTTLVVPQMNKDADTFVEREVLTGNVEHEYAALGLSRITGSLENVFGEERRQAWMLEDTMDKINAGLPGTYFKLWWDIFRNQAEFFKALPPIERVITHIPQADRIQAIAQAKELREKQLLAVWQQEFSQLDRQLAEAHNLTPDMQGWQEYLKMCFEKDDEFHTRFGFDDWSTKFTLDMLNRLSLDKYERMRGSSLSRIQGSYFDYFFGEHGTRSSEIWWTQKKDMPDDSLLVHALGEESLTLVVKSGVLGSGGEAQATFSQDRVIYDRGWVVIFQAKDLLAAGYSLLPIYEDFRDAHILKEWRTPPIDIRLARLIVPTSIFPDRKGTSGIATSYYGEKLLRELPRI